MQSDNWITRLLCDCSKLSILLFPRSAFFVFCADHRPRIKGENPGIGIGDIAKELGKLWGKQGPKDKAPYEAKAAKLKEKYDKVRTLLFPVHYTVRYIINDGS